MGLLRGMLAVFCSVVLLPVQGTAEDTGWASFGVRGGYTLTDQHADFSQYEAYAAYWLPWSWRWPGDLRLAVRLEGTAGVLCRKGAAGFAGSLGPEVVLEMAGGRVFVSGGSRATLLGKDRFDDHDFGGPFQFTNHVGIGVRLQPGFRVGYRYQHMSNADMYSANKGLNIHMLELGVAF